jgi:putative transposase
LNYIHNNPVKAGFVLNPEDWPYSSARLYSNDEKGIVEVTPI